MSEKKSKWKSFIADVSWFIKEIFKSVSNQIEKAIKESAIDCRLFKNY